MGDQDFKILITGDASSAVSASQQAGQSMQELKEDMSGVSDETKKSLGMLSSAGDQVKDLGSKTQEAGEKMELTSGEARRLGNELGRASGLGNLGAVAMGGVALAAFGAGKAIEFLRDTWKDIQEAIKGPINVTISDDAAGIESVTKALNAYADARRKAAEGANSPEAVAGRENKAMEHKLTLLKQVLEAEEKEALANLAANKDKMSPQAYAAAESQIHTAYGTKGTLADENAQKARIATMQKEADELHSKAAEELAQGKSLTSERAGSAQGAAIQGATDGKEALAELKKETVLLDRIAHPDNAMYEGMMGFFQKQKDRYDFRVKFGADNNQEDARKDVALRTAQAKSQIKLGVQAEDQGKFGNEQLAKATADEAKAAVLDQEAGTATSEFNEGVQTHEGIEAIGHATRAIGQEHEAEGNNTATGHRDQVAALNQGAQAAQELQAGIKNYTGSNVELLASMKKAFEDLAAENRKLMAQMRQTSYLGH